MQEWARFEIKGHSFVAYLPSDDAEESVLRFSVVKDGTSSAARRSRSFIGRSSDPTWRTSPCSMRRWRRSLPISASSSGLSNASRLIPAVDHQLERWSEFGGCCPGRAGSNRDPASSGSCSCRGRAEAESGIMDRRLRSDTDPRLARPNHGLPIVGDEGQLPSVDCGSPLADCCRLEVSVLSFPVVQEPRAVIASASVRRRGSP